MVDGNAGKGDKTASRTNHKALQAGWDRLNRAIFAAKRKRKREYVKKQTKS